jgi:hypothetical protein
LIDAASDVGDWGWRSSSRPPSACGGGSSNGGTPLGGGTAAPVSVGQLLLDLGSYLQVIDRYARVFQEIAVTVGDMQTAAAALTVAREIGQAFGCSVVGCQSVRRLRSIRC